MAAIHRDDIAGAIVGQGGPGMGASVSKRQIRPSETQQSIQSSPFKKEKKGF